MRSIRIFIVLLITSLLVTCGHFGNRAINEQQASSQSRSILSYNMDEQYQQITTHPDIDIMPSLSPNKEWIAFSSKRSGNYDIWIKRVNGGKAIQVTEHRADDFFPVWSPDSKLIYFVSYREDAAGDIWSIEIVSGSKENMYFGEKKKITDYLGIDESPGVSPNGKMIAFTSDRDGLKNIWIYFIKKRQYKQLTYRGGVNPSWSPDSKRICYSSTRNESDNMGALYVIDVDGIDDRISTQGDYNEKSFPITDGPYIDTLPSWSPYSDEIVFTRYSRDTNNDGELTPSDNPALHKVILKQNIIMQITPDDKFAYFPNWGEDGNIYYVSSTKINHDIWSISEGGPIPKQDNAFLQYQFADLIFPLNPTISIMDTVVDVPEESELQLRLLAFNRIFEFFPEDTTWTNNATYEIIRTYYALGEFELAKMIQRKFVSEKSIPMSLRGNLQFISLKSDVQRVLNNENMVSEYLQLFFQNKNKYYRDDLLSVKFELTIAELYTLVGDNISALEIYENIIKYHKDKREFVAISHIRLAEIYNSLGQIDEVSSIFADVVNDFPDQRKWVDYATSTLLKIMSRDDHLKTIENYRKLIDDFNHINKLCARLKLQIAVTFSEVNDYPSAIKEINSLVTSYPNEREEIAQAKLLLAGIYVKKNDVMQAINILKTASERFNDLSSGLYVIRAKEKLLNIYLESARRLRNDGDLALAITRYRGAMEIQFNNVEAHRGQVFILSRVGRIDDALNYYMMRYSQNPDDEIIEYILGLCYSYKSTDLSERERDISKLNISMLKKSNQLIEDALSKNYQLIHAYLTLSYNYEIIEQYQNYILNKKKNFAEKLFGTISAPVVSLFRFITFQRHKTPERWYERAIDVLVTGISLNDEKINPQLESELALNLAQNYYNLEEFGYEKAYEYYHTKLEYDTTFESLEGKAEIFKRMGHCAVVIEDDDEGPVYLLKAIDLYKKLKKDEQVLINLKRLALLYQSTGAYEDAIEYYLKGIELEKKFKLWNEVQKSYRSIAYNYQLLNDEEEAIRYANQSIKLLKSEKVRIIRKQPNYIKIGVLGIEFPVFNMGLLGAGESTAIEGFTSEEETALTYSIIAQAYLRQKNYIKAIEYYNKKLDIYRKNKDRFAESIFLNNIGLLYYIQQDYDNAGRLFNESFEIAIEENLLSGIIYNAINLASIGIISIKKGEYSQDLEEYKSYLKEALEYYDDVTLGLERERAQLFILLGNLTYYQYVQNKVNHTNESDLVSNIVDFNESLSIYSKALDYYESADSIALTNNLIYELILIDINKSHLYSYVNEYNTALKHLHKARIRAIKNEYNSQLWRIDYEIALKLINFNEKQIKKNGSSKDAGFYFIEAIELVEEHSIRLGNSIVSPIYSNEVENLYKDAIKYFNKRDPVSSFTLTERMRAKKYLDIIGDHKLELKKERHKNYIGLARDDNRRIVEIESQIRQIISSENYSQMEIRKLQSQKREYQAEYLNLLKEMNSEDPELESMVYVNPELLNSVKNELPDNTVIINYCVIDDSVYVWLFNKISIEYLYNTAINIKQYFNRNVLSNNFERNIEIKKDDFKYLVNKLILPILPGIEKYKNIVFIPDDELFLVPFHSLFIQARKGEVETKTVVTSPSVISYYFSYKKRKIRGNEVLFTEESSLLEELNKHGYDTMKLVDRKGMNEKQVRTRFEENDVIHLDVDMNWNTYDPLMTRINIPSIGYLETRELYSLNLESNLIVLNAGFYNDLPGENNFISFNRAALYAGTPTILYSLWSVEEEKASKFYSYFYEYMLDHPPGEALSLTKSQMIANGEEFNSWGGYQLFGYQGMSDLEEMQYSLEQLEDRVTMGYISYEEQDYEDAINDYEQALDMAKTLGSNEYVVLLRNQIIESAAMGGNYQKAIDYQLDILNESLYINDEEEILKSYRYLAIFYTEQELYDQALVYQKKYITSLREKGDDLLLGEAFIRLGLIYERISDFNQVLESLDLALNYHRDAGNDSGIAEALGHKGRINLMYIDDYTGALNASLEALATYESLGDHINIVKTKHNIGLGYEKIGDYRSAYKYYYESYTESREIGDQMLVAISNQFLANINWKMGEYETALNLQNHALEAFEEWGERKYLIIGYSTKGLIMMSLGQTDDALEAQNNALMMSRQFNERADESTIQKNIGLIHLAMANQDMAYQAFEQSLIIDQSLNSVRGMAYSHRDFGILFNNMSEPDSAIYHLDIALDMSKRINDRRNMAHCYYEIGRAYIQLRNYSTAIDSLLLAENMSSHLLLDDILWRTKRGIAHAHRELGHQSQTSDYFEEAINIIEKMRAKIKVEQYQSGFIDDKVEVYGEYIEYLVENGQLEKSFEILERSRSRSFLDLLANKDINFGSSEFNIKYNKIRNLENKIDRMESRLSFIRSQQGNKLHEMDFETALIDSIQFLKDRYTLMLEELDQTSKKMADVTHVRIVQAFEIREKIDDSSLLVEYFKSGDRLFIWTIGRNKTHTYSVDADSGRIEDLIGHFRKSIDQRTSVVSLARQLYSLLIVPIREDLIGVTNLVIVPHGILHYLPFAALMDENSNYLIDKYSISISPSASVLEFCLDKGSQFKGDNVADFLILAFGNPELNSPEYDLPFAEKEIESIKFDYENVLSYMNQAAS